MFASLSVRAICVHPLGAALMVAELPPCIAIVASINLSVDTLLGFSMLSVVDATWFDAAVLNTLSGTIAANAAVAMQSEAIPSRLTIVRRYGRTNSIKCFFISVYQN